MAETGVLSVIMAVLMGIGLSAAVGFKVFTPLLFISVLGKMQLVVLDDSFLWLASPVAIIIFATATVIEILCSFIPFIDNMLDAVGAPMAVTAGTLLTVALLGELHPAWQWTLGIIAGGGTAGIIKTGAAALRSGSSTVTAGLANPVLAAAELSGSIVLTVLSVLAAPVAFCLVVVIVFFMVKLIIKLKNYIVKRYLKVPNTPALPQ